MSFDRSAVGRAWPSYWLCAVGQRLRPWTVVAAVAACATLALLAQPILTAAWSDEAVRFIARAAELQERARTLASRPATDPAVHRWLDDSRSLLADLPLRLALPVAAPADAFEHLETARPLVERATLTVAEALHRHLRVDVAVRIALLIAALGGAWIGFRLRRGGAAQPPPEGATGPAAAPPPEPWLALIDRIMTELADPAPGRQALTKLCEILREALGAHACGLCVDDDAREAMQLPAVIHAGELGWAQLEQLRGLSVSDRHRRVELPLTSAAAGGETWPGIAVPIGDGQRRYGHLFVVGEHWAAVPPAQLQVLELVGRHLAMAIGHCRRDQENRRIALLEERSSMARELHDSLAQSLSFMKIQISRMQTLLERGARREDVAAAAAEVRDGLNGAYRKLRELLTTFRTQIDAGGLAAALEEALEEYGARSCVAMTLDNRLGNYPLNANEEFHIVQIVREALSNVVRHAGATQAVVSLSLTDDGLTAVTIEDDGQGFDPALERRHHHGTTIMRERALSLGGALSIDRRPEGGSRVVVRFKPATAAS